MGTYQLVRSGPVNKQVKYATYMIDLLEVRVAPVGMRYILGGHRSHQLVQHRRFRIGRA